MHKYTKLMNKYTKIEVEPLAKLERLGGIESPQIRGTFLLDYIVPRDTNFLSLQKFVVKNNEKLLNLKMNNYTNWRFRNV